MKLDLVREKTQNPTEKIVSNETKESKDFKIDANKPKEAIGKRILEANEYLEELKSQIKSREVEIAKLKTKISASSKPIEVETKDNTNNNRTILSETVTTPIDLGNVVYSDTELNSSDELERTDMIIADEEPESRERQKRKVDKWMNKRGRSQSRDSAKSPRLKKF